MWLGLDKEAFQIKQREEPAWEELASYLEGGRLPTKRLPKTTLDQFALQDELLYFVREGTDGSLQFNIIVPRSLITKAIQHAHELSGHLGQKKTIKKAEELYYWVNLKVDVSKYVKEGMSCPRFKGEKGLQVPWKELPPVTKPLERIGINLTDMVAGIQGYRYVLTVVDHYSRFVRFFPLKTKHTHTVIEHMWQYVADYGTPLNIVMDNGGEFTSKDFQEPCHCGR